MTAQTPQPVPRPDAEVMARLRHTRRAVAARPERLAEEFYQQLFVSLPDARPMFAADLGAQEQRMTTALIGAVKTLEDIAFLEAYLRRLGAQHARDYGVRPDHYPHVGQALVRAVRALSPSWDEGALGSAWMAVGPWISDQMRQGATETTRGRRVRELVPPAGAWPGRLG
jgi:hemoglobin-like flavoprotein